MTISLYGEVAIVTGTGGGIGRAYALELARRGAANAANDYGGGLSGRGAVQSGPSEAVAAEVGAMGGQAAANDTPLAKGANSRDRRRCAGAVRATRHSGERLRLDPTRTDP